MCSVAVRVYIRVPVLTEKVPLPNDSLLSAYEQFVSFVDMNARVKNSDMNAFFLRFRLDSTRLVTGQWQDMIIEKPPHTNNEIFGGGFRMRPR